MFFNNNLEKPDVFPDEGTMYKVSPNPGLNLTLLRTTGPSLVIIRQVKYSLDQISNCSQVRLLLSSLEIVYSSRKSHIWSQM